MNGSRIYTYSCRVIGGKIGISDDEDRPIFRPGKTIDDFPLNGPGMTKAVKKATNRLRENGLDLRVYKATEVRII